MHITAARRNMDEIGNEIGQRIKAVMDANPDLTPVEICLLRPDLAFEVSIWNRCSLALQDD